MFGLGGGARIDHPACRYVLTHMANYGNLPNSRDATRTISSGFGLIGAAKLFRPCGLTRSESPTRQDLRDTPAGHQPLPAFRGTSFSDVSSGSHN
jgi:hypothetical protein